MKLIFEYSVESEINRVKSTINKKDFFKKIEYRLGFPEGFSLDSTDFSDLEKQIKKELAPDKVELAKKQIMDKWTKSSKYIESFVDSLPYDKPETLNIVLTQYGVGGSYWPPNRVIINLHFARKDLFETVTHELVHLLIEGPVIQKYQIKHESKEALIDYIGSHNKYLKKALPDYHLQERFVSELPDKKFIDKLTWL